jgi:hypothetical protein
MVYINQIDLSKEGLEKNKTFLGRVFTSTALQDASKWFDYYNCLESFQRKPDASMSLETFLKLLTEDATIKLQLASPEPFEIRYGACFSDESIERYAFVEMPYSEANFEEISKIYENCFGRALENEPISHPSLIDYYHSRIRGLP